MRLVAGIEQLAGLVNTRLGHGDWLLVDQARIDAFAEATEDRQWIHVDVARAEEGPFGGTVAHGYLTLSLLPELVGTAYRVSGVRAAVNYGLDRVRFPAPLPAGSLVRATVDLLSVSVRDGGVLVRTQATVHRQTQGRPVLVAEPLTLLIGGALRWALTI